MCKSIKLNRLLEDFFELGNFLVIDFTTKLAPGSTSEIEWREWMRMISIWRGRSLDSLGCRRGGLPGRQTVVFVVTDDIDHIYVAAACMDKVSDPNSIAISISSDDDDGQCRICERYSRSKRQGSPVERLCAVSVDILGHFAATADTGDDDGVFGSDIEVFECLSDDTQD